MDYEFLLKEADHFGVSVYEEPLKGKIQGFYGDNVIWINKLLPSSANKYCILAEELGHYHTSTGDILDQKNIINRKQEARARSWAYERIMPLSKIIEAHEEHIRNKFEFAEYMGVTEEFLEFALKRYKEKYGVTVNYNEKYTICFEPLGVIKWFDKFF